MEYLMIGEQLKLPCPNGFHLMSDEEKAKLNFLESGKGFCLRDEDRHMLVSIGWKETGMLTSMLLSDISLEKNMESSIRQAMQPYGFQPETHLNRQIAGMNATGFRYTYTAQNISMLSESYVLRNGQSVIYFHLYARNALRDDSLPVWNDLLASVIPC